MHRRFLPAGSASRPLDRAVAVRFAAHTLVFGGALLFPCLAAAQQPAPRGQPAAQPAAQPAPTAPQTPPTIDVSDPLLAAVPPPKRVLHTWKEALTILSSQSTPMRIAVQEVERAEGLSRQALAGALTTVTGTGTVRHQFIRDEALDPEASASAGSPVFTTVPRSPTTADVALTARQPILAPRVWYGIGTARRGVEIARVRVEDQRRVLLASLANAIVAVVTAERLAEVNRVGLKSALSRLELMQRRLRLEAGTKLDVVQAEQDLNLARLAVVSADDGVLGARESLGVALGSAEPWGVSPTISLDGVERSAQAICRPGTIDERADVRAALLDVALAERGVTDAKLAYAPTADVSTTLSYASEPVIGDKHYSWTLQGVLTIPIWDGGSRYGEARSARAEVEQSKARLDLARRTANVEASQAGRAVRVADTSRQLATQGRDLAKETARLSQVAFEAGNATSFELVETARRAREAELNLVVRELELVQARIASLLAASSCNY